ncbi:MAG: SpoIVB peptidase S55 domain-containing protein [Candidatus Brocadiaceae bacterium]|uniref:SpoIVB peptidase S55 domain-containing protein n=1 Tax=Candidatus Wunengus sp. YC61 TaxID=3367698 RepID=UPI002725DC73|nr:SpoIVB peptidase S55 domain-containing protein [Candidatus Brocadiaceae bacterium]
MKLKSYQLPYVFVFLGVFSVFISSSKTLSRAAENIMNIDEIVPGMKGYGKTVFSGDRVEMFNVEVLGILRNWEAKSNMILIKMSGDPLEKSGIIAGMSGSPVYIDNRLIGAVAYGWSFAKEAIAGVTPINEMKSTLLNIPTQEKDVSLTSADWELPSFPQNGTEPGSQVTPLMSQELTQGSSGNMKLTPILAPLVVSGVSGEVLQKMQPLFNTYGLYPVQGGSYVSVGPLSGKGDSLSEKDKLVPGASVAAILVKGDLSAAVVGTVTYVEGDNVLAFGHPFLQTGTADLPMASAYVYAILTSQSNSVKMASPREIVGRIHQDRRAGIAGILGESSRMVPCRIEVEGSQSLVYDFEIIDNKLLTPSLVLMAAQSAVLSTERRLGEKSVNIKLSALIDGYEKPVVIENVFYELDPSWFPLNHIVQPFAMILNNQFQKVRVNRIDLKIKVLDARKTAYIEAIKVDKKQVKPGDTLQVDVRIKPFTGESFYQTVLMQIPEDTLPGSTLNVTACDATYGQALNMGRSAGKFLPTNFEQLLHYVENMERNNNLMVRVLLPKKGVTYKGEGFPSLPTSMLSIMSFSNQSGIGPLFDEVISRIPTAYVVSGNQSIPVSVK